MAQLLHTYSTYRLILNCMPFLCRIKILHNGIFLTTYTHMTVCRVVTCVVEQPVDDNHRWFPEANHPALHVSSQYCQHLLWRHRRKLRSPGKTVACPERSLNQKSMLRRRRRSIVTRGRCDVKRYNCVTRECCVVIRDHFVPIRGSDVTKDNSFIRGLHKMRLVKNIHS